MWLTKKFSPFDLGSPDFCNTYATKCKNGWGILKNAKCSIGNITNNRTFIGTFTYSPRVVRLKTKVN